MKFNSLRQLIKEELKKALNEVMFKEGDIVTYMGEKHKVLSDDGFIIELTTIRGNGKKENIVKLNYRQAKEKLYEMTPAEEYYQKILNQPSFLGDLELGAKYKVSYAFRDNQGEKDFDDVVISITQDDINEHGENTSIKNYLTYKLNQPYNIGYKVINVKEVEKITDNTNELKKEINEILDDILQEDQLKEIQGSQINVGDVFTLNSDIGLFKSGETVQVKDKKVYGSEIKIILSNDQGVTDDFLLDINDDFEQLG
jgi:hypothetical protein